MAMFIFAVTAFVHLTHNKSDFQSSACEPASCASADSQNGGDKAVCLACMIVNAFQTAQIIVFLFIVLVGAVFGFCPCFRSNLHSLSFPSSQWVRGPPPGTLLLLEVA
jgi:hypothetical protein